MSVLPSRSSSSARPDGSTGREAAGPGDSSTCATRLTGGARPRLPDLANRDLASVSLPGGHGRAPRRGSVKTADPTPPTNQAVLDDFTDRWERGEIPSSEAYLALLGPVAPRLAVEVVYREYCLAERDGRPQNETEFLARFPQYRESLQTLLAMHRHCTLSEVQGWIEPDEDSILPVEGDEIGPYILRRELGRGAFARVFLAEQADLEFRQVVVKLATRLTREPWLMARVRHAHIVEILSHAEVDDGAYQLICMPFLGGATLATLLAHRRNQHRGPRVRGGLLLDLDAVAAPEYAGVNPARPARELLRGLTDDQALAWITARLAEALDHAFSRDVAHGDVKPSNIIVTADGNPMLLDFNLAQDWSPSDAGHPPEGGGGTLAYMAPERLRALCSTALAASAGADASTRETAGTALPIDPHRADIYSLGKVLLEALTGISVKELEAAQNSGGEARDVARGGAASGEQGAEAVIRTAESLAARRIPRALRTILERCLAENPADRYRRGVELAEDLDRWRTDRPLAYAAEPFWAQTLPRWLRAEKTKLSATALIVTLSLSAALLMLGQSQSTLANWAIRKVGRYLDDTTSHAFQFQRPGSTRLQNPRSADQIEGATHALKDYDVLENADWRNGDAIRYLPARERDELRLWLTEQAFRYGLALRDRSDVPADWMLAIETLDRVDTTPPLRALVSLRSRLIDKLAGSGILLPEPRERSFSTPSHPRSDWVDQYLLGVDAELAGGPPAAGDDDATGAGLALEHYQRMLAEKPESFWGHYRAAVVCFRLGQWKMAAGHLNYCLKVHPKNAALRGQYASCLWKIGDLKDALEECNRAIELAPNQPEFYQSRAFVLAKRNEIGSIETDLDRFYLLRRSLGRPFFRTPPVQRLAAVRPSGIPASRRVLDLETSPDFKPDPDDPQAIPEETDPDELTASTVLAETIFKSSRSVLENDPAEIGLSPPSSPSPADSRRTEVLAIAAGELDRVLALNPDLLNARRERMMQFLIQGRLKEAQADLELVLNHPRLAEQLQRDPREEFEFFRLAARRFARYGLSDDSLRIVDKMTLMADQLKTQRGRTRYSRATVLALTAGEDAGQIDHAARLLAKAISNNSRFLEWYRHDRAFDQARSRIDAALKRDGIHLIPREQHPSSKEPCTGTAD